MITPSGWTLAVWSLIYVWQLLWIVYIAALSYKKESEDIMLGPVFYIAFIASNLLNAASIITWCHSLIVVSGLFLFASTIAMLLSTATAHTYAAATHWFDETVRVVIALLALNGSAFYAQWLLITLALQLGVILCFEAHVENGSASFVALAVLSLSLMVHCSMDFVILRNHLRFTFTPYIAFVLAFAAIISKHGVDAEQCPPSIMALLLLILTILVFAFKIYLTFFGYPSDTNFDASFLSIDF